MKHLLLVLALAALASAPLAADPQATMLMLGTTGSSGPVFDAGYTGTSIGAGGSLSTCYVPGTASGFVCHPGSFNASIGDWVVIWISVDSAVTINTPTAHSGNATATCESQLSGGVGAAIVCSAKYTAAATGDYWTTTTSGNADVWITLMQFSNGLATGVDLYSSNTFSATSVDFVLGSMVSTSYSPEAIVVCAGQGGTPTFSAGTNFSNMTQLSGGNRTVGCEEWIASTTETITASQTLMTTSATGGDGTLVLLSLH